MPENNPNIEWQKISVRQLRNGDFKIGDDKHGIATYILSDARVNAILSCPYHTSEDNTAILLCNVDGTVVSRAELYGTRLKLGDDIVPCLSGTALATHKDYRHLALATDIIMFIHRNKEYAQFVSAGLSGMAIPLYTSLKYAIFEIPVLRAYIDYRTKLSQKGLRGGLLWVASKLLNLSLLPSKVRRRNKVKELRKRFDIRKVDSVPEWVDDIVLNDGHKYMEVHGHTWLQWNLNCNYSGNTRDIQSFYCIYDKAGKGIGFFMTKERCDKTEQERPEGITGSLVEWGSNNPAILSEEDINVLALESYGRNVAMALTSTDSENIQVVLGRYGLVYKGSKTNICCKANKKKTPDIYDIKNWRIRLGYADTIFS